MDIEKYLKNKSNVRVLKLVDDGDLIGELDSCAYEYIVSLDNYKKNVFSDNELVVIIADLRTMINSGVFKNNYGLHKIMLLISNDDEFKNNISYDFEDEPIGTNMDVEVLYEMYKAGSDFSELITKGNTVPEGKKPVSGFDAVVNMKKKFKD